MINLFYFLKLYNDDLIKIYDKKFIMRELIN